MCNSKATVVSNVETEAKTENANKKYLLNET